MAPTRVVTGLFAALIAVSISIAQPSALGRAPLSASGQAQADRSTAARQRAHSKLWAGQRDWPLRPGSTVVIDSDVDLSALTIDAMKSAVCAADAVVKGVVLDDECAFTEDGCFIFTDYEIRTTEIVRSRAGSRLESGARIFVTRRGGSVVDDDVTTSVIDQHELPLVEDHNYILLVHRVPGSDTYSTVNLFGAFDIDSRDVRPMSEPVTYRSTSAEFLKLIRETAAGCTGGVRK